MPNVNYEAGKTICFVNPFTDKVTGERKAYITLWTTSAGVQPKFVVSATEPLFASFQEGATLHVQQHGYTNVIDRKTGLPRQPQYEMNNGKRSTYMKQLIQVDLTNAWIEAPVRIPGQVISLD